MTSPGSDFTKVNTKRYKIWRIVRTNPVLVDAYKRRIVELQGYRTAIIFPEQLLNLNQSYIFRVTDEKRDGHIICTITVWSDFKMGHNTLPISTAGEIFEAEGKDSIYMGARNTGDKNFIDLKLFSGKADALKYASKRMEKLLNSIA